MNVYEVAGKVFTFHHRVKGIPNPSYESWSTIRVLENHSRIAIIENYGCYYEYREDYSLHKESVVDCEKFFKEAGIDSLLVITDGAYPKFLDVLKDLGFDEAKIKDKYNIYSMWSKSI